MLLRTAIGHALKRERERQGRTLRDVSLDATIALGYLSEVERGQKEVSSELLDSVSHSLGLQTSELIRRAGEVLMLEEQMALSLSK